MDTHKPTIEFNALYRTATKVTLITCCVLRAAFGVLRAVCRVLRSPGDCYRRTQNAERSTKQHAERGYFG